jgi:hypothetical protein
MVGDASITTNDVSILLPSVVGHPDYFVQNKNFKKRNQRTKRQKKTHDLSPDATRWIMSRKKIPSQQCSLVIVVQPQNDKYEEKYHKAHHRYPNPVHQGKYFIPFLSSAMDKSNPYVKFHMISIADYKKLQTLASDGIEVGDSGAQFDEFILDNCPSHSIELLCVDDLILNRKIKDYHGCIKVFAGGSAANIVDNSFQKTYLKNSKWVACSKFCDSNEYNDHIPLSMGFFDSTFHKLKISPKDVTLFQRK